MYGLRWSVKCWHHYWPLPIKLNPGVSCLCCPNVSCPVHQEEDVPIGGMSYLWFGPGSRSGGMAECELWGNVTAEEKKLKARLSCPKSSGPSPESLCRGNAIRARRAVEDRQYKKVLQSLTSAGLVQPSNDVLAEMLAKHPISSIPTLPADPLPLPSKFLRKRSQGS